MCTHKINRDKNPLKLPIRYSNGVYEEPCPFGVLKNPDLEDIITTCPVCGDECTCGCLEQEKIAGVGGDTCLHCVYHVQVMDEQVICYNPGVKEQL